MKYILIWAALFLSSTCHAQLMPPAVIDHDAIEQMRQRDEDERRHRETMRQREALEQDRRRDDATRERVRQDRENAKRELDRFWRR